MALRRIALIGIPLLLIGLVWYATDPRQGAATPQSPPLGPNQA